MTLSVHLRHSLGDFALDIAFEAPPGVTVLYGASGSGKTSVANAVAGLLRPETGRISVAGRMLVDTSAGLWRPPHKRRIGYIFQDARLFPHLTVRRNLTYGARHGADQDFGRVVALLGIGDLLNRRPLALSGGEKSRVAIGRALLSSPDLIVADEPLAALDDPRKAEILPYFERLRDEARVPILYVSHSAAEVARLATTVVVLENGRVIRRGSAGDVLSDPEITPLGPRGAGAMIEARIKAHHDDGLTELDAGGAALFLPRVAQAEGTVLRIRIAAHEVILSRDAPKGLSALNVLPCTIAGLRPGGGPGTLVSLTSPAGPILARITTRSAKLMDLAPGMSCHAILKSVAIAPEDIGG